MRKLFFFYWVAYLCSISSISGKSRNENCLDYQFKCEANGDCVDKILRCDGIKDCPDGSDETKELCGMKMCSTKQFQCKYGACVKLKAKCDGRVDCADKSDEENPDCPELLNNIPASPCGSDKFQCKSGKCIFRTNICNGRTDCLDGSDETIELCWNHTECLADLFRCDYGACIYIRGKCNGVKDCADGSDESFELCNSTKKGADPDFTLSSEDSGMSGIASLDEKTTEKGSTSHAPGGGGHSGSGHFDGHIGGGSIMSSTDPVSSATPISKTNNSFAPNFISRTHTNSTNDIPNRSFDEMLNLNNNRAELHNVPLSTNSPPTRGNYVPPIQNYYTYNPHYPLPAVAYHAPATYNSGVSSFSRYPTASPVDNAIRLHISVPFAADIGITVSPSFRRSSGNLFLASSPVTPVSNPQNPTYGNVYHGTSTNSGSVNPPVYNQTVIPLPGTSKSVQSSFNNTNPYNQIIDYSSNSSSISLSNPKAIQNSTSPQMSIGSVPSPGLNEKGRTLIGAGAADMLQIKVEKTHDSPPDKPSSDNSPTLMGPGAPKAENGVNFPPKNSSTSPSKKSSTTHGPLHLPCKFPTNSGRNFTIKCDGHCDENNSRMSSVNSATKVSYFCLEGYNSEKYQEGESQCVNGTWYPEITHCKRHCPKLHPRNMELDCFYKGNSTDCEGILQIGTIVRPKCAAFYKEILNPYQTIECQADGKWSNKLFQCIPDCGKIYKNKPNAADGEKTKFGEAPWFTAIYRTDQTDESFICGGTIITPYLVLSAEPKCYFLHRECAFKLETCLPNFYFDILLFPVLYVPFSTALILF